MSTLVLQTRIGSRGGQPLHVVNAAMAILDRRLPTAAEEADTGEPAGVVRGSDRHAMLPGPDPIHAAIVAHRTAWDAFQTASEGGPSEVASLAMAEALDALLATSCETRSGALALLKHLTWWLDEETEFAGDYEPEYGIAKARAADLTIAFTDGIRGDEGADPILAAVAVSAAAEEAHFRAVESLDEDDDRSMARANAACDAASAARLQVAETTPTTLTGIHALAMHYAEWAEWSAQADLAHLATALQRLLPAERARL
ncbi:hypothetical protein ASG40_17015 [Methylobacterium sp. Leaf399]|uniref:hypothetical protein n=1 Tax=Methylobacterium sp. Leaf399 TaxID=1736364 RepID=UPI0007008E4A|nr:hypothetical protein [Methylobacterium sp. Leaf399]KQT17722.1 hypothetical protein ASG40_17015 [Methylobacterium sp. Leaf399]